MNHLPNHPHAILDENNVVINILAFDAHDSALISQIKESLNASNVKCCCDYGYATIDGDFFNGKFYLPKPNSEWIRDEEKGEWVAPKGWVNPNKPEPALEGTIDVDNATIDE